MLCQIDNLILRPDDFRENHPDPRNPAYHIRRILFCSQEKGVLYQVDNGYWRCYTYWDGRPEISKREINRALCFIELSQCLPPIQRCQLIIKAVYGLAAAIDDRASDAKKLLDSVERPLRSFVLSMRIEDPRQQKTSPATITEASELHDLMNEYDVFLAHNSSDKRVVKVIAKELRRRKLKPWLDKEQIPAGQWFQDALQNAIRHSKSVAVFFGQQGIGKWEIVELRSSLQECVERGIPIIPVLLPGVETIPDDFPFLKQIKWVKFKSTVPEVKALQILERGIRCGCNQAS